MAHAATDAINKVNGTLYDVGNSADLLCKYLKLLFNPNKGTRQYLPMMLFTDAAAGGSDDWFKGENGAKYAYTVELPGGGSQGFDPPPSKIIPIVKETWEGIKVGGNLIASKYGQQKNV